ncbi:hypothetical protein [Paenibacillus illinoisensis]|uniref:hypothetical protein n=1 Tax=Paenibacillus illinoisensis TaxID=59845 RepID=UPI00301D06BC
MRDIYELFINRAVEIEEQIIKTLVELTGIDVDAISRENVHLVKEELLERGYELIEIIDPTGYKKYELMLNGEKIASGQIDVETTNGKEIKLTGSVILHLSQ